MVTGHTTARSGTGSAGTTTAAGTDAAKGAGAYAATIDVRDRAADDADATTDERVRRAAVECIGRWGVRKTTLEDVARTAGVSRATIYRTFPGGKDALLDAVLAGEVDVFFDGLRHQLAGADGLDETVTAGVVFALQHLAGHDALRLILAQEPELVLPQFAFHRLDPILRFASAFVAPYLEPHLGIDGAARGAEFLVRVVLSYAVHPPARLVLDDADAIGRFVTSHVLPGLTPSNCQTTTFGQHTQGETNS